jgi:glycosyltransferase involved in cell wall biosynthesis
MRVLALAEECNPDWPSLPLVGYNVCRALAERVELTVATHVRNRPFLEKHGVGGADVIFVDNEYVARPMYRAATFLRRGSSVNWTTNVAMAYLPYLAFEREVWRRFQGELRGGRFDLVHRVTPMSPTLPSPMASWSPVPFVLGPLNGGLPWPPQFREELRRERESLTYFRGAYRLLPYYRSTYRRAAAILAAFPHTRADLPEEAGDRIVDVPEVGIDPSRFQAPAARQPRDGLRFLYAGRLVPYKCPDVAILAFAESPELRRHHLTIVGDGPERPRLETLVREHGLTGVVEFTGGQPQAAVAQRMAESDVFVFPSIRELGAGVVVEAMACSLPCVVVDYGGPGALIDDAVGIKLPLAPKAVLVSAFRDALERLAANAQLRGRLGEEARRRALEEYAWSAKAAQIERIYAQVLERSHDGLSAARPGPPPPA